MKLFRVQMELEIIVAAENKSQALLDSPDFIHEAIHEVEVIGATEVKKRNDLPQGYRNGGYAYTTHPEDIEIDTLLED